MREKLLNRFLRYIAVDTQSDPDSKTIPSTAKQLVFARQLAEELKETGLEDISVDKYGYVIAKIGANTKKKIPAIGFLAHIDTSPAMKGKCTNPKQIANYDGKTIVVNSDKNIVLDTKIFPELLMYKGQTIIHTDGTTLLGADDKAGIAEIITAMEYIIQHPEIEHGLICVGFTPDEETGTGIENFDVQKFGANYAYTVDGGGVGELEYENFNAVVVDIDIQGLDIHPGTAKGKMINSQLIAMEIESLLPPHQKPEYTDNYEGFFLLTQLNGSIEYTTMQYIIRDHDKVLFEEKKQLLVSIIDQLNNKYKHKPITCKVKNQYYNMREKIEEVKFIVTIAEKAMKEAGIIPVIIPIRGGTDGARLSFMGLP
ncbi:MAG: peptidase T, partial [Bacteroidales bacterium]|nr:peptidase T [Bacteroidales bacterium]